MLVKYIPHPSQETEVDLEFDGKFNELTVYISKEHKSGYCFVAQINDRLTVKDMKLELHHEFVNKDQLEEYALSLGYVLTQKQQNVIDNTTSRIQDV